jgi:farnesyl diphosphate synthase
VDTRVKTEPAFDLGAWSARHLDGVERALERWVTAEAPAGVDHGAPAELVEAMRYAVLDGGKRLRPLLVMAAWEAVTSDRVGADARDPPCITKQHSVRRALWN